MVLVLVELVVVAAPSRQVGLKAPQLEDVGPASDTIVRLAMAQTTHYLMMMKTEIDYDLLNETVYLLNLFYFYRLHPVGA